MADYRLKYLLWRYADRSITQDELQELIKLIPADKNENLDNEIDVLIEKFGVLGKVNAEFELDKGLDRLKDTLFKNRDREEPIRYILSYRWLKIAAIAVLFLGFGIFWILRNIELFPQQWLTAKQDIMLADEANARICLTNGATYDLLKMNESALKQQGVSISKDPENGIIYSILESSEPAELKTFINPKGGIAKLKLADGTLIWLNSGAEVQYLSRFDDNLRKVSIKGEAYFEVAHEKNRPFVITAGSSVVKVLGTSFNVKAMQGANAVFTTLIDGSVQVKSHQQNLVLIPGEQAKSMNDGGISKRSVNVEDELAWKAGYFRFEDDDIYRVMEQIESWYDIKGYKVKEVTADLFTGALKRTKKLTDLLEQLEKISSYKFKIEDGEVLIMK